MKYTVSKSGTSIQERTVREDDETVTLNSAWVVFRIRECIALWVQA